MDNYIQYPPGTNVRIKETGEIGEAFESSMGFVSVYFGDSQIYIYELTEVEFI